MGPEYRAELRQPKRSPPARAAVAALAVLALASVFAMPAQAQLYVCTDNSGRTISADKPPAECSDRQVRELRRDGSVRRVIEPPLTAAQRAQREAEERRQKEEAERRREQMRKDLALLDAYANEQEIEDTRARALASRLVIIERARERISGFERERKKLDTEAEFYAKRELPDKLKRSYQLIDTSIRSEERIIADAQADIERVNERFDSDVKRFREMVNNVGRPAAR